MAFNFDYQKYQTAIENEFTIIDKKKKEVPFLLNKAQQHAIKNLQEQNIILKARKMGFSSLMLAIGTIKFLFGQNERVVSMSFDASASTKQLMRAKQYIKAFEYKNKTKLQMKYNSKTEMMLVGTDPQTGREYTNTLAVGTAKSGSFGRGDDISFLHLTEVAFCDDLDALLTGVGEALVDGAMFTMETTANGFNEFKEFWDSSVKGETGFNPMFYSPEWEYSQEFLEKKKMKLKGKFLQEYPMDPEEAFITSGESYFDKLAMKRYLDEVKQISKPIKTPDGLDIDMFTFYRMPRKGEFFIVFVDTAGEGSDNNSGQFLSHGSLDVPIVLSYQGSIVDVTPKLKTVLEWLFDMTGVSPVVAYETNNGGGYELDRLDRLNKEQKYKIYTQYKLDADGKLVKTDKKGWNTNSATRPAMMSGVEEVVNNHLVIIYHRPVVTELFSFVKKKTASGWKAEAETGSTDDHVLSLAGVWQLFQTESPPTPIDYMINDFPDEELFNNEGFY